MDKKKFLLLAVQYVIAFCLVYWLVGINIWLDLFLAGAMTKESFAGVTVIGLKNELENYKLMFSISDNELVRVSALTTTLEDKIYELEEKISKAEDLLQEHDVDIKYRN